MPLPPRFALRIAGLAAMTLAASCFRRASSAGQIGAIAVPISVTQAETLRTLPVLPPATPTTPATTDAPARGITVTAHDADARSLLIAIAREAGISIVVSSDVRRRVSVSLTNASPEDAIAAIIAQAGLSVTRSAPSTQAVVYYQLPVNVNQAPAETIVLRFGVGNELAKWLVDNRTPQE